MAESNEDFSLTVKEAASLRRGFKYCPRCRAEMVNRHVFGRVRRVCPDEECRFVQFIDPKVSAAVMVKQNGKVLLTQRAMSPGKGSWCFPGGFIENREPPQQTAIRECKEETGLEIEITGLIDVFYYEDFRGSGVLIMYQGRITGGQPQPSPDETEAIEFFGPDELPENIVFDSNLKTLAMWRKGEI